MAAGDRLDGLAQERRQRLLVARRGEAPLQRGDRQMSGRRSMCSTRLARARDRLAQRRRQRVDARRPRGRCRVIDRLAAHRVAAEATARSASAAGRRSARGTPRTSRRGSRSWPAAAAPPRRRRAPAASTQPPSEPSRGQLAPPSASTVGIGVSRHAPLGRVEQQRAVLVPADPVMAQLEGDARRRRAAAATRAAAARSSWPCGNTRPLEPTNVSWPSPSHQARSAAAETPRSRRADAASPAP